ncbi:TDT family transporter [Trueperella sp. LYQ141]|uniref:TDT family transporter n=1 Tax=Trueperella sp. LYQ141 TaxID=3391058 RepID=UPI003982D7E7
MAKSYATQATKPQKASPLPPPSPTWYPAAMGTGILGTLLQIHHEYVPGAQIVARIALIVGWLVLTSLTAGFLIRIARSRKALWSTFRDSNQCAMWGTVSMGFLAVGSATATVVPAWFTSLTHLAWSVNVVLWIIGTTIGVVAALLFAMRLVGSDLGAPTTVWGLAVVGPMVSSTTGAALVPHIGNAEARVWLLVGTVACFFLSLCVGTVIFAVAYHHHWRISPVALAASCSSWIPLGMVGQSTAAAQAMASQAITMVDDPTAHAVQQMANLYGLGMFCVGVPLVLWATITTVRGFLRRMPFSPGWWALTFPIGTLSLGAHNLGAGTGVGFFTALGVIANLVLFGTVCFCLCCSLVMIKRRGMAF